MGKKLFGTDGIRGLANEYPMTVEMAVTVGKAVASFFAPEGQGGSILIGKDTRISGDMLSAALAAGICSMGCDAVLLGCIPTPAVAYLTRSSKACAGIVISASHNPYYDNGIKIFGPNGYKLSEKAESDIEMGLMVGQDWERACANVRETGGIQLETDAEDRYMEFLSKSLPDDFSLSGIKLAIDCANGATSFVAPLLFERLGAETISLFVSPDGTNINENCGSQHPETLSEKVVESGSKVGLAFDGDGDRLIAVDENGVVLTGDQIIAICGKWMQEKGTLSKNKVVTTVMSNLGLKQSFEKLGVEYYQSGVGDRSVLEKMIQTGSILGGEDSGHMIFLNHHTTGDGLHAALQLLWVMADTGKNLSELKDVMTVFPQILVNVTVREKPEIESIPEVVEIISEAEKALGETGRVLVRYSGTEPICRVMVEGPTEDETNGWCTRIADAVKEAIGREMSDME